MKKIIEKGALCLIGALALTSCNNDDIEMAQFDAIGDCFVQKQVIDGEVKYGATYYAYANMNIKSVSVTTPGDNGQTFELQKQGENSSTFSLLPQDSDFTNQMPAEGEYTFSIVSMTQDTITSTDKLLSSNIDAIEIEEFTYEQEKNNIKIDWNTIEDADLYAVRVMEEKGGKLLYVSPQLATSEYEFSSSSQGWFNGIEMEDGKSYIVGVFAYKYENSTTPSGYDLQMECADFREINW